MSEQVIALDPALMSGVRDGSKRVTVRVRHRGYRMGETVLDADGDREVVIVDSLRWTTVREYDPAYLAKLLPYYPDATLDSPVTVVGFRRRPV